MEKAKKAMDNNQRERHVIEFHYNGGMLLGVVVAESTLEAMNKAKRSMDSNQWIQLRDQNDNTAILRSALVKFILYGGTV